MMEATTSRAETRRIAFSVERLSRLTVAPGKAEAWVFDAKSHWLGYRLTASGVGAFYIFRRINGRPAKIRLGGQELSIEQARALADEVNVQITKGIDPREQRRQDRVNSATLGDLVAHFIDTHSRPHKRSWQDEEAMVRLYLADWKSRRLSAISQDDIQALHARVGKENGKYAANRLLSLLHTAFEKAGKLWKGANPVDGITKFTEKSRDRYLTAEELPRFFKALADEPNQTIRDYLLILLLVGARRSNTAAMRWEELDLDRATWRIPETKNGLPLIVPLAREAVQILRHRQKASTSEWVFPTASNTKRSKSGHIEQFRKTWEAILKRAGIADFRLHDLRRTFGSWMAMTGSSLPAVGRALGHLNPATTAVYARMATDSVRIGVDTAAKAMRALPSPKKARSAK